MHFNFKNTCFFYCYIEKATGLRSRIVTELLLDDISDDVGTCWCKLGLKLKIGRSKIHNLGEEYRYNREKAYALLLMWKRQEGRRATVGHLSDALSSIGEKGIAEKILLLGKCSIILKCFHNACSY